jgi:hypothetical protein
MRKALAVATLLGLAACNAQPAQPTGPRIPRIDYPAFKANPSLYQTWWPKCAEYNGNGTLTRAEDSNCRLLTANNNLYASDQRMARLGVK